MQSLLEEGDAQDPMSFFTFRTAERMCQLSWEAYFDEPGSGWVGLEVGLGSGVWGMGSGVWVSGVWGLGSESESGRPTLTSPVPATARWGLGLGGIGFAPALLFPRSVVLT